MSNQIDRLQSLRFAAAFMVLVCHVLMEMEDHGMAVAFGPEMLRFPWGAGVDLFFVISGFIIAYISWDRPGGAASAMDFFARRFIRIWPTYLIFSVLALAAIVLIPATLAHQGADAPYVLASLAFIPWPRPGDGELFPVLGQGWTLNYEMFFYVLFAGFLLAPKAWRFAGLTITLIGVVVIAAIAPLPKPAEFYGDSIILEFALGIGLCWLYRRGVSIPGVLAGALIAASLVVLLVLEAYPPMPRVLSRGLACAVIVSAVMLWRRGEARMGAKPLPELGDASYALYLSHPFVVNALLVIWMKMGLGSPEVFALVSIAASVMFSVLFYRFVETPLRVWLMRRYNKPRAGVTAPVA